MLIFRKGISISNLFFCCPAPLHSCLYSQYFAFDCCWYFTPRPRSNIRQEFDFRACFLSYDIWHNRYPIHDIWQTPIPIPILSSSPVSFSTDTWFMARSGVGTMEPTWPMIWIRIVMDLRGKITPRSFWVDRWLSHE